MMAIVRNACLSILLVFALVSPLHAQVVAKIDWKPLI